MEKFEDYPTERTSADKTNENMVCFFCKTPVKDIQGKLETHKPDCKYRIKKEESN